MFKSITYLRQQYESTSNKYIYYYHLVDDELECEIAAPMAATLTNNVAAAAAATASAEYHKRNLPLIKNLYLLNIYILREWYSDWSFEELLDYQKKYIDEYYPIPGINFSKDIYPKLLKMNEELFAFE